MPRTITVTVAFKIKALVFDIIITRKGFQFFEVTDSL